MNVDRQISESYSIGRTQRPLIRERCGEEGVSEADKLQQALLTGYTGLLNLHLHNFIHLLKTTYFIVNANAFGSVYCTGSEWIAWLEVQSNTGVWIL